MGRFFEGRPYVICWEIGRSGSNQEFLDLNLVHGTRKISMHTTFTALYFLDKSELPWAGPLAVHCKQPCSSITWFCNVERYFLFFKSFTSAPFTNVVD